MNWKLVLRHVAGGPAGGGAAGAVTQDIETAVASALLVILYALVEKSGKVVTKEAP